MMRWEAQNIVEHICRSICKHSVYIPFFLILPWYILSFPDQTVHGTQQVILYEDELADNGISLLTVKVVSYQILMLLV